MSDGFDELFSEQNAKAPRKRRGVTAIVWGVIAVLLVGCVIWADGAARGVAEDMVESELSDRLPASSGPTEATIGGFAFLPQFFAGALDDLEVNFALSAESIPRLAGDSSTAENLKISGGVLEYEGVVSILGVDVGYTVEMVPSVEGGQIVLTPTTVTANAEVASLDLDLDLGQLVDLESLTVRACAASLLPESMTLTSVDVKGSKLHFSVSGTDVPVNLNELRTRGSCE